MSEDTARATASRFNQKGHAAMDAYSDEQAERFANLLTQRELELRGILQGESVLLDGGSGGEPREVADFKDLAVRESQATVDEAQAAHAASELEQVLAARRRLAEHRYGVCLDCGDPIDLRRLVSLPATALCTSCQSAHELGQRRAT